MRIDECLTNHKQSIGRISDCFCNGIYLYVASTQSHRPEEAITRSHDKCEPDFGVDPPFFYFIALKSTDDFHVKLQEPC